MKKIIKVVGFVAIILILFVAVSVFFLTRGLEEGKAIVVEEVDLSLKENGTYLGSYEFYRWNNIVEVTIENGRITEIIVNDEPREEQEKTIRQTTDSVIGAQSTQVEVVSGATVTSKTYLKAIADALN